MNVIDRIKEFNPDAILWDDLNDAVIGFSSNFVAVYDIPKIIECLMKNNSDWTMEDATEWFDFNIDNHYIGENTPIHIYLSDDAN